MQLRYEDRLRVWMAALLKGMAYWNGRGLLIPVREAVAELNASLDLGRQIRCAQLKRIVAEFKDTPPPYSSCVLKMRAATRRAVGTEHSPASGYGNVLVNSVPRWNNGGHRLRTETRYTREHAKPWLSQGVSRATWYRRERETPNSI